VNPTEEGWVLIQGWLLDCVKGLGPYHILIATGEQGSAKSPMFGFFRSVIDPVKLAPLASLPREERDLGTYAAKQAHAHRFIESELPHGYETIVGPLGGQLSGGQRQRISLARAILRNPSILILDEATSQVDLESEQLIQKVLEKFVRDRTVVIITHRLSTLVLADRIAVMQDGRILDIGTHNELIARCELYRRLYEIQFDDLKQSA